MTCLGENTVLELVDALLEPARRADIEAHTASCEGCRRLISELARRSSARAITQSPPGTPSTPALEIPPGTSIGRFVVRRVLGRGAMGAVYAALDPELEREVALKVLHTDERHRARIQHEARALARLAHPNVVTAYELGSFQRGDGDLVLAMELVDGEPLRTWMRAPRTVAEIVDVFAQVGRGLAAAHAAGLVHRDVKPDNVVVGRDGRARLIDFGLAGVDGGTELVGTPAYMAPELLEDGGADARADQFAFCVALYEALHGERPFAVNLRDEVARGVRADAPTRKLPPALTAGLARGLALEPSARFADLPTLLAAIAPPPRSRRRAVVGGAVAVASLAAAITWGAARGTHETADCAAALTETWNPARASALHARFAASGASYAGSTWRAFEAGVERFTRGWIAGQTDACEAARVRGTQSDAIFTLRAACYARARAEADGVLAGYERGPAIHRDELARAASAADALAGAVAGCANVVALLAPVPPPSERDAAIATTVLHDVALAHAARDAARWPDARARATTAAAAAATIDHAPTRAAALFARGEAESGGGDGAHAELTLREAYATAARGRDDLAAARAAVELVWVLGQQLDRYADGLEWAFQADIALARVGGDPDVAARLANNRGNIFYNQNKFAEARAAYQRALELRVQASGADSRGAAQMTANLARAVMAQGNNDEARSLMTRAVAGLAAAVGPDHPDLAMVTATLASIEFNEGKWAASLASFDRALAISEPALGADHPEVGRSLCGRGLVLIALGRARDALPVFARSLAIFEPAGNAQMVVENLLGRADAERLTGDHTAALASCRKALAIDEESFGKRSEDAARAHECVGDVLAALDRHDDALAAFKLALAIRDEVDPADYVEKAHALSGIGAAEHRRGRAAVAVEPLRRAVALLAAYNGDPVALAQARVAFARALWDARPGDPAARSEALTAGAAAEPALVAGGELAAADLAALRSWQRARQ